MNFFTSTQTRPVIPTINKDDCIRQLFHYGNVFYSPEIGYGVGVFEFEDGGYQLGEFSKSSDGSGIPKFDYGEFTQNNTVYRGKIARGDGDDDEIDNENCEYDFLTDANGEIEWSSGIRYNGSVHMDRPTGSSGVYTIPVGTMIMYHKHAGILSRSTTSDKWSATFSTGNVSKIFGTTFDIAKMCFKGEVNIMFTDGCVFSGTEFEADETENPGVVDVFTVPPKFTVVHASRWGTHQLNMWLLSQPILMKHLSVRFFDKIHKYSINCRQLLKFERRHFKSFGVSAIDDLLLLDAISQIGC